MFSTRICLREMPNVFARDSIVPSRLILTRSKVNCKPIVRPQAFATYSTFNAHSSTANGTEKTKSGRKLALWPKVKAFTTFTASGTLVIGGAGLSVIVIYLILSELFSPSGDTQIFNRSVSLIEKDDAARALLQCNDTADSKERLKAYGETFTSDKWTRNRPIVSNKKIDKHGRAHHFMRFHVESKKKVGLVHVEAVDSDKNYQPDFKSVYLDVPGEHRHYLIKPQLATVVKPKGFLGVNWGPKKD